MLDRRTHPVSQWHARNEQQRIKRIRWPTIPHLNPRLIEVRWHRGRDTSNGEARAEPPSDELSNTIRTSLDDATNDSRDVTQDDSPAASDVEGEEHDDDRRHASREVVGGRDHRDHPFALRIADGVEEGLMEEDAAQDTGVVCVPSG